jgi:MATE family multidrug resistance protein
MKPVSARVLLALAWPAAASVILNNAWRVLDQFSVQWLGTEAQAALSSFTFVLILCYAGYTAISAGVGPLLARATGAIDPALQRRIFGNGLVAAILVGVVILTAMGLGAPQIAGLLGLSGETARLAVAFLQALCATGLGLAIAPFTDACFFALGDTRTPMVLQIGSVALNAGLNYLFIYAWGGGIAGAALASTVSRTLTVGVGLYLLVERLRPTWGDLRPDPALLRRILGVGLPIGANTANYALVYWALLHYAISPLGPTTNAALGIGFSALEGFTWPLFHGISLAVASLVGRNLGAGRPDEARRAARLGFPLCTGAGLLAMAAFYFLARPLCGLFTEDPAVLEAAVIYAQILAFSQLFVAWESLSEGVLEGAGDTRTIMLWSTPLNLLRVPLGYALAIPLGWGAAGVWWAINFTTWAKVAGKGWAALRGDWARRVI